MSPGPAGYPAGYPAGRPPAIEAPEPYPEWTLPDLFAVLARRRAWIVCALALFSALAILYALCATPRYRAEAEIEVRKDPQGSFGLDNSASGTETTTDSFDLNLTLQTEISILQSDSLALDVIRQAGLETTPDYFNPSPRRAAWSRNLLRPLSFWRRPLEPLSIPLAGAPNRRYAALRIFAGHLKVSPVAGTRLIRIAYSDPDPARAAAVVNALVQALSDYGYQSRSTAAAQSAAWLSAQLSGLRQQAESLDARAAALQSATGSYGDDASHNIVLARLDDLNAQLSAAESSRIVREAIWRAVQTGDPEVISGLGGNPASAASTQNSYALLQSLRAQETAAKAQLAESGNRYGDAWPAVAEQRARLSAIGNSIHDEIGRLGDRARSDYQIALQAENSARDAFNQQKALAAHITGSGVPWRLARQEADESRALYTTLLGRLQQTGVLEGLHPCNFTIVSPARVPPPDHPTSPSFPLLAALAIAAGLSTGSAAAIARELTDDTIRTPGDLENLLEVSLFAALPPFLPAPAWYRQALTWCLGSPSVRDRGSSSLPLWLHRFPPSPPELTLEAAAPSASDFAFPASPTPWLEALHYLRASLLLFPTGTPSQIITLAPVAAQPPRRSPLPGSALRYSEEEQPSLALSLATVLAQHGSRVLFVDADLRAAPPAGALSATPGLSDLLAGAAAPVPGPCGPPLLSVVHAGSRPPCPSEIIASPRLAALLAEWRRQFTFIVIQSPAAHFADALVLARQSDAVLLSARAGKTRKAAVLPAFRAVRRQLPDHAVLGLLLEDAPTGVPYARP